MFTFQSEADRQAHLALLAAYDAGYDPQVRMHRRPFSSPGYHTTLQGGDVHSTRDSLTYAVALLDSGEPAYIARGKEIALAVAALQDKDPQSPTYGIWSWFYEEPLSQMAPPDWNWADFCGKEILQILRDHGEHLAEDERKILSEALFHACHSIIRRNVDPSYTNISFMGTYVTYVGGALLGLPDVAAYAKKRLRAAYDYNMEFQNFREYNSPTYTMVAVEDLTRFHRDMEPGDDRALVYGLLEIAWKTILTHLHPPTRQWAGPHKRSYAEALVPGVQAKLQKALKGRMIFLEDRELAPHMDLSFFRIGWDCPDEFLDRYFDKPSARAGMERFARDRYEGGGQEIAFAHLAGQYNLASFHKDFTWNQCRPVVAYLGKEAFCLRLQLLHDFYDYSSGFTVNVQKGNALAGILAFATDGGDTHPNLDMVRDGAIRASDLRLRFRISGPVRDLGECSSYNGNSFRLQYARDLQVVLHIPHASFGDHVVEYDVSAEDDAVCYDVILYRGGERAISFPELGQAAAAYTVEFLEGSAAEAAEAVAGLERDTLTVTMGDLSVSCPARPATFRELHTRSSGSLGGVPVDRMA